MKTNFDPQAQKAIQSARIVARQMKNTFIGTEHLLIGILQTDHSALQKLLSERGITAEQLKEDIQVLFGFNEEETRQTEYTQTVQEILEKCLVEAARSTPPVITLKMLTRTLLETPNNVASELLRRYDVDIAGLIAELNRQDIDSLNSIRELRNLNQWMANRPSNIVERQAQMNSIIRILCRKEKANPLLLGDPGVGKTALVEQLAKSIDEGEVPDCLRGSVIFELSVNGLVAGTKYRGEFEEKIQKILDALRQFPQVILFIDEIHQIIGAGKAEGSIDVAGVLKPVLARGEIRCIGATTYDEYLKFIEKDRALQRRFQPVMIEEPDLDSARRMIEAKIPEYEQHHQIQFPMELVGPLMESTQYFMPSRKLPDKALDVIDLACASARMDHRGTVAQRDVDQILEQLTDVPLQDHRRKERVMQRLRRELIGQEEILTQIDQQLQWMELGVVQDRPLGVWLLCGKQVSLKQRLAKVLAQLYFGQNDRRIEVDMMDYQDSQAGYRFVHGQDQQYSLWLEKLRRSPYSLLFIRNLDAARPECAAILRKGIEQGLIEEEAGRKVDLRHCLILLDTEQSRTVSGLGFQAVSVKTENEGWDEIADAILDFRTLDSAEMETLARRRLQEITRQMPQLAFELGEDTPFDIEGEDPEKIDRQIRSYLTNRFKKSAG